MHSGRAPVCRKLSLRSGFFWVGTLEVPWRRSRRKAEPPSTEAVNVPCGAVSCVLCGKTSPCRAAMPRNRCRGVLPGDGRFDAFCSEESLPAVPGKEGRQLTVRGGCAYPRLAPEAGFLFGQIYWLYMHIRGVLFCGKVGLSRTGTQVTFWLARRAWLMR